MNFQRLKTVLFSTPAKVVYAGSLVAMIGVGLYLVHVYRSEVRQQVAPALRPAELMLSGKTDIFRPASKPSPNPDPPTVTPSPAPVVAGETGGPQYAARMIKDQSPQQKDVVNIHSVPKAPVQIMAPLDLYPSMAAKTDIEPQGIYAPQGMFLRCQLSKSISTSNLQTPIVAQVLENLEWEGEVVIPAGVIIHGRVAGAPQRDRIGASTEWLLVWPFTDETSGLQMSLTGDVLDCNRTPDGGWGKSDGTAGIRGEVVDNSEAQRMYAYMATFISGLGEGMVATENIFSGGSTRENTGGTWKDSLGKAFQKVGEQVASELIRSAVASAYYVEAEAGTQFYIYVTQTIDLDEARRGTRPRSGRVAASPANNPTNNRNRP